MTTAQQIERLRREVAMQAAYLGDAVSEVEGAARRTLQVREWVRRSPLMSVTGAFMIGWWWARR